MEKDGLPNRLFALMPPKVIFFGGKVIPEAAKRPLRRFVYPYRPYTVKELIFFACIALIPAPARKRIFRPTYRIFTAIFGTIGILDEEKAEMKNGLPNRLFALMPPKVIFFGGKVIPEAAKRPLRRFVYPYRPYTAKEIMLSGAMAIPTPVRKSALRIGYRIYISAFQIPNLINRYRYSLQLQRVINVAKEYKQIIIYPPTIDWGWMKQRPHHILEGLSERGYFVFWSTLNLRRDKVKGFQKIKQNFWLTSDYSLILEKLAGLKPIVFFTSVESVGPVKKKHKDYYIAYDYLDDLSVYLTGEDKKKIDLHHWLLKNATIVTTTAEALADQIGEVRDDFLLIPNAAEYDHFHIRPKKCPEDLQEVRAKKQPIIGYYGALAKWFDFNLLMKVANSLRHCQFVLIGPNYDGEMKKYPLHKYENIHWLGLKDYHDLPSYLAHFDVAILPFIKNKTTDAVSPVKLFEYMSGSKPIVTTNLHECERFQSVLTAKNAKEFASQIKKALQLKDDKSYLRLVAREAKENSWKKRVEKLEKQIEERILTK